MHAHIHAQCSRTSARNTSSMRMFTTSHQSSPAYGDCFSHRVVADSLTTSQATSAHSVKITRLPSMAVSQMEGIDGFRRFGLGGEVEGDRSAFWLRYSMRRSDVRWDARACWWCDFTSLSSARTLVFRAASCQSRRRRCMNRQNCSTILATKTMSVRCHNRRRLHTALRKRAHISVADQLLQYPDATVQVGIPASVWGCDGMNPERCVHPTRVRINFASDLSVQDHYLSFLRLLYCRLHDCRLHAIACSWSLHPSAFAQALGF